MPRCHFLGPRLFIYFSFLFCFSGAGSQILCCASSAFTPSALAPPDSVMGVFPGPPAGSSGRPPSRAPDTAPRSPPRGCRGWVPSFVLVLVSAAAGPGGRRGPRPPRRRGLGAGSAWCGFRRGRPCLFRYLAPHRPLLREPGSGRPRAAFSPPRPAFCSPRFPLFPPSQHPGGPLGKTDGKAEEEGETRTHLMHLPGSS